MQEVLDSLRRYQFFSLLSGVIASNVLSLLAMPILARMYPVEAFGVFAVFWSLSSIMGMFATLRLDVAIPAIKDLKEVRQIAQISGLSTIAVVATFLALWYLTTLSLN